MRPRNLCVTLAEAKAHCYVDYDDDDALIADYIAAAVRKIPAGTVVPQASIKAAILLLVGALYFKGETWDVDPLVGMLFGPYVESGEKTI